MSVGQNYGESLRCPNREELRQFLAGKLPDSVAEAVGSHTADCHACEVALEELDSESDELTSRLRDASQNPPLSEAECARATALVSDFVAQPVGSRDPSASQRCSDAAEDRPGPNRAEQIRCPFCHETLEVADEEEHINCVHCGGRFRLVVGPSGSDEKHRVPSRIARFEFERWLGEGSFGVVWKARDTVLGRTVAVKMPHRKSLSGREVDMFLREARLAAQLRHPHIVQVHEVSDDPNVLYIVSDYIDGENLAVTLDGEPMPARDAVELLLAVVDALQQAQSLGIVHRDLKPANIVIDREGKPYLTDFGLARNHLADPAVTLENRVLGTPAYMSPEQAQGLGSVDGRSDLYSLGVILFELLTGNRPFRGDLRMMVAQILFDEPPRPRRLNDRIPKDLETICLKCLEKSPGRRYQTAEELALDLRRWQQGEPIRARPISWAAHFYRRCKRHPALTVVSVVLGLVVLVSMVGLSIAWRTTSASLRAADAALEEAQENFYFHQIGAAHDKWLANDPFLLQVALNRCPPDYRGFEWGYLKALAKRPLRKLRNAGASLVYSPDGTRIITSGGKEMDIKVWDAASLQLLDVRGGHRDYTTCLDLSPDGRFIASAAGTEGEVKLWDAVDGREVRTLGAHGRNVVKCCFDAGGNRVVSSGLDRCVRVWDVHTGEEIHVLNQQGKTIRDIAVSPCDSRLVISAGQGAEARIAVWDLDSGKKTQEFTTGDRAVMSVAFSPDGQHIATAELHGVIRLWNLSTEQRIGTIPHRVAADPVLTFDPSGKRIAAASWDNAVRLWDVSSGEELRVFRGHIPPCRDLCFSPDGRFLARGGDDDTVHIWDTTVPQGSVPLLGGEGVVKHLAVDSRGEVVAGAYADGRVLLWSTETRELLTTLGKSGEPVWSTAFSPDGTVLAVACEDTSVRVFNTETGGLLQRLEGHVRPLRCVAFHPSGKLVASSGLDRIVRIWDWRTGTEVRHMNAPGRSVTSLSFSPSGDRLTAGTHGPWVITWDVESGKEIWRRGEKPVSVANVAWSPCGKFLAFASMDGVVQLRRGDSSKLVITFGDLSHRTPVSLVFSPDGTRLATATAHNAITIWEVPSGRAVLSLRRGADIGEAIAFHPDGRWLATASIDGTVLLWPTIAYHADRHGQR